MAKKKEAKPLVKMDINGKTIFVRDLQIEDIIEYCKDNNEVAWLKKTAKIKKTYNKGEKKGQERPISYVELKAEFMKKFYADKVVGDVKKKSFYDLIDEL